MAGSPVRLALAYRARQSLLQARLVQQLVRAWRDLLRLDRVDASWPALRALMEPAIQQARRESERLAADAYMDARRQAGIPNDTFEPDPARALDPARLRSRLEVAGPVQFKQAVVAGRTPEQARDTAAVRIAGTASYMALEGGRELMQQATARDERATGWSRVTDADPCAWCAMLASRGPVYKSAVTAGDPRQGGTRYHDLCGCQAWPAFTLDEPFIGLADQLYQDWRRVTRGTGGRDAVNAFRRWWEAEGRTGYQAPARNSEGR
jgi:hypothetical protein